MNHQHLQQIFDHYIERFEELNDHNHWEYYKWQIVNRFRREMDVVLAAPQQEFAARLMEVKRLSANLIDNYTQPFYGLVKFAEEEPETVREMFQKLYGEDGGDIIARQKRVQEFLQRSHALRERYYPNSYLYKDDMHSVTGYLFLYDPDHNYIFKATHAQIFADCIEFYEDWGTGQDVRLDVYYRMCDEVSEAIKRNRELLLTDAGRFAINDEKHMGEMYPDPEKHILVFDLLYCCHTYGLYDGISFVRPKSKERQLMQERKEKAVRLAAALEEAKAKAKVLDEAKQYVNETLKVGTMVRHRKYGVGVVKNNHVKSLSVEFPEVGEKLLGTFVAVANGIIQPVVNDDTKRIEVYREVLKQDSAITGGLSFAEKEFAPYAEYLG